MNNDQPRTPPPEGIAKPASPRPPRCPWYRLHWSTWFVVAAGLGLVVIVEIPARYNGLEESAVNVIGIERGWPAVYWDQWPDLEPESNPGKLKALRDRGFLIWASRDASGGAPPVCFVFGGDPDWLDSDSWHFEGDGCIYIAGLVFDITVVVVWLIAIVAAWEWWSRHRWHYSLRTLFCVFTLVAVALAWWRTALNGWEREQKAVESLAENARWSVGIRCDAPLLLRMLVGEKQLTSFCHVVQTYRPNGWQPRRQPPRRPVCDDDFEHFGDLSHLELLYLHDLPVTDRCLTYIERLPNLKKLVIDNGLLTDEGVRYIRSLPRLESLTINRTPYTEPDLKWLTEWLAELRQLKELTIADRHLIDEELDALEKALPNCKINGRLVSSSREPDPPEMPDFSPPVPVDLKTTAGEIQIPAR